MDTIHPVFKFKYAIGSEKKFFEFFLELLFSYYDFRQMPNLMYTWKIKTAKLLMFRVLYGIWYYMASEYYMLEYMASLKFKIKNRWPIIVHDSSLVTA